MSAIDVAAMTESVTVLIARVSIPVDGLASPSVVSLVARRLHLGVPVPPVLVTQAGVPWHGFEVLAAAVQAGVEVVSVMEVDPVPGFSVPTSLGETYRRGVVMSQITGLPLTRPVGVRMKSWNRYVRLDKWRTDPAVADEIRQEAARLCGVYEATGNIPAAEYRHVANLIAGDAVPWTVMAGLEEPFIESEQSRAARAAAQVWRSLLGLESALSQAGDVRGLPGAARLVEAVDKIAERLRRNINE